MKISVIIITYRHDLFIKQTIESVLMQNFNGEIELIISNDNSPDNTNLIVNELIENNTTGKSIRYTFQKKNLGMIGNFYWALSQCTGNYIALCDGDDYWTDPQKLQKQFDFLEGNPNYLLCAHRIVEQKGNEFYSIVNNITDYTFSDFSFSGSCNGIYTCSMIFRNIPNILDVLLLNWTLKLDGSDYLILLLSTINGHKVKLLDDVMGVYRIHDGGVWSSSSVEKKVRDAIISNRLCIENLNLSKIQKNQVRYGLAPRIRQYYYAKIKNRYIRKTVSWLLKIILIMGPGSFSNRIIDFFSNRIVSRI